MSKGVIHADAIYTTEQLRNIGLGSETLKLLRDVGLHPMLASRKHWYRGASVIEAIEKIQDMERVSL